MVVWTIAICAAVGCSAPVKTPAAPAPNKINPTAEEIVGTKERLTLYFQFMDQPYLSSETRDAGIKLDERLEKRALEELFKGASAGFPDLRTVVPSGTRVLSVEDFDGVLFVTLNREFLGSIPGMPISWESDVSARVKGYALRRLALASIVNTAIDNSDCYRVVIMIAPDENNVENASRVSRAQFVNGGLDLPLEPQERSARDILTPANMVRAAMTAFQQKDWGTLYKYVALRDASGTPRPSREAFNHMMGGQFTVLVSSVVGDAQFLSDGQRAIVDVKNRLVQGDGLVYEGSHVPLKLIREAEAWKISYYSLLRAIQ